MVGETESNENNLENMVSQGTETSEQTQYETESQGRLGKYVEKGKGVVTSTYNGIWNVGSYLGQKASNVMHRIRPPRDTLLDPNELNREEDEDGSKALRQIGKGLERWAGAIMGGIVGLGAGVLTEDWVGVQQGLAENDLTPHYQTADYLVSRGFMLAGTILGAYKSEKMIDTLVKIEEKIKSYKSNREGQDPGESEVIKGVKRIGSTGIVGVTLTGIASGCEDLGNVASGGLLDQAISYTSLIGGGGLGFWQSRRILGDVYESEKSVRKTQKRRRRQQNRPAQSSAPAQTQQNTQSNQPSSQTSMPAPTPNESSTPADQSQSSQSSTEPNPSN